MHAKTFSHLAWLPGLILAVGAAEATELFTPPLVPEGNNVLDCYLVNVSDQTRAVKIRVLNREGEVLESIETTLDPGQENVARAGSDSQPRYCQFIVEGKKSHFRASILVRKPGVGSISALSAE